MVPIQTKFQAILTVLCCFALAACVSTDDQTVAAYDLSSLGLNETKAFRVHSAHMSEAASDECIKQGALCEAAPIAISIWQQAFKQAFEATDSEPKSDYEILVGSQALNKDETQLQSEITLQWRGFALDTFAIQQDIQQAFIETDIAQKQVTQWIAHASALDLFSSEYLYYALRASNYRKDMQLPSHIGEFFLAGMQLYPDPFDGAIARYRHPKFADALFDINVSPILQPLPNIGMPTLEKALQDELARAHAVADERHFNLVIDTPISHISSGKDNGFYFAIHATDEFDEPLYAAAYVFKQQDKLVKFTSTFPHEVSQPIVEMALAQLMVPTESTLMKELRQLL